MKTMDFFLGLLRAAPSKLHFSQKIIVA